MTKLLHVIKAENCELSDSELVCIESWKRAYPDFEIKYWDTDHNKNLIEDCKLAKKWFKEKGRGIGYVVDYMRLKVLYENGGLVMDTDVYVNRRLEDSYFDKPFMAWANGENAHVTNNGTCQYCEPHDKLVGELIEFYKNDFMGLLPYNAEPSNWVIDLYLRKYKGLNPYIENCSCITVELDDLVIYDYTLFGGWDFGSKLWAKNLFSKDKYGMISVNEESLPYFIHCRSLSWIARLNSKVDLFYLIVDKDSSVEGCIEKISRFIKARDLVSNMPYLIIYVADIVGNLQTINACLTYMGKLESGKDYTIIPLGINMSFDDIHASVADRAVKAFSNICTFHNLDAKYTNISIPKQEGYTKVDYVIGNQFDYDYALAKKKKHKLIIFTKNTSYENAKALIVKMPKDLDKVNEYNLVNTTIASIAENIVYLHKIPSKGDLMEETADDLIEKEKNNG